VCGANHCKLLLVNGPGNDVEEKLVDS